MSKLPKIYRARSLVKGFKVQGLDGSKIYVAVPDKGYKDGEIKVLCKDEKMLIKNWHNAVAFRRFHDNFNRDKDYVLGYFEWKPEDIQLKATFTSDGRAIIE